MSRDDLTARAERAKQLFGNPAFRAAYDEIRDEIIKALETVVLDGSQERADQVLEYQRQLSLLTRMRRAGMRPIGLENAAVMSQTKKKRRFF